VADEGWQDTGRKESAGNFSYRGLATDFMSLPSNILGESGAL